MYISTRDSIIGSKNISFISTSVAVDGVEANGNGNVVTTLWSPLSTGLLYPKFLVKTSGIIQKLYETKTKVTCPKKSVENSTLKPF